MDRDTAINELDKQLTGFLDPAERISVLVAASSLVHALGAQEDQLTISHSLNDGLLSLSVRIDKPEPDEVHVQIPALSITPMELSEIESSMERLIGRIVWLHQMHGDDSELTMLTTSARALATSLATVFPADPAEQEKLPVGEVVADDTLRIG